jgi:N-acetyl-anhydromuramyl-L-alanine amidase AmpD
MAIATPATAAMLALACALSRPVRRGQEIEVCGQHIDVGVPTVLWHDPGGYDAYQKKKHFDPTAVPDGKLRYSPIRGNLPAAVAARVGADACDYADLQEAVHLFVLHFDMAGTSRQCFKVLQDVRNLSVHFLLDVDGTLYQTLDLREKAHHATIANDGSIGVEIAHPGLWPQPRHADMLRWYVEDEQGWRMKFPGFLGDPGVRTPAFVPRPDRPEPIAGEIHGKRYWQFDYTPQQYRTLAHLCAALSKTFPRIRLQAPRDADGRIRTTVLRREELHAFDGIVGHFHVQTNKTDPGPALQWDRLLGDARAIVGE